MVAVLGINLVTYLVVGHTVTTSGRRTFAFDLKTGPFPRSRVQMPEVVVMIESSLLGRRKFSWSGLDMVRWPNVSQESDLTSEQVNTTGVTSTTPSMTTSRERAVWTSHLSPLATINQVDIEIVEECRMGSVVVLAAKQQQLIAVRR